MNLHANAALSLNKRRDLCQRVVLQDWTLTKAAEAAEVSVRCARKRVGRSWAKLGRLGLEPACRYERQRPGELVHIDVKRLGRIQTGAGKRVTGRQRHNRERTDVSGVRRKMVGWECCSGRDR